MKIIKVLSLLITLMVMLSACHKDEVFEPVVGNRTVLVYVAAYNSLGRYNFDSVDLQEMMVGVKDVDVKKNNLLVYFAAYGKNPQLIHITKNDKGEVIQNVVLNYDSQNSVSVGTMKEVFSTVFSQYPANSYGIVFWSHGDGWIPYSSGTTRWWGQDTRDGDERMNITELHDALSSAPHFDFIFFDACFMQSVEVIYQLRDCANYFIGSPTEIPGPGAPYDVVVPAMFSSVNPEIEIARSYYDVYANKYDNGRNISNSNWTGGVSLSVVKSSELACLAAATKNMLSTANKMKEERFIDTSHTLCYDPWREKNYRDLKGVMKAIHEDEVSFEAYETAHHKAVVWANTTVNNYCTNSRGGGVMTSMDGFEGLSTYVLDENETYQNRYYRQNMEWYFAAGWAEINW